MNCLASLTNRRTALFMTDQMKIAEGDRHAAPPPSPPDFGATSFVLAESNHRISNNLSLLVSAISMRRSEIVRRQQDLNCDEVASILNEISARIVTVGNLHRFMAKQPEAARVDLESHLFELCETLIATLAPPGRVELVRLATCECFVAPGEVLPICLIITEIVTNSLKYAHPAGVAGKIALGCRREDDDSVLVEVGDDGVGLPEGYDLASDGGIGSRTIRVLAKQLGADLSVESRPIGLWFTLRLPADR